MREKKDCIVVDKATFPRVKLCGGLFTGKSQRVLGELLGKEMYDECMGMCMTNRERKFSLWQAEKMRCSSAQGVANNEVVSRPRMLVEVEPRKEIVLIDRPRFDEWMVRHYERVGGRLIEGDGLVSVDFANGVARLSSGREISYRTLIAADGANGTVERLLRSAVANSGCCASAMPADWDATRGNSLCLEVNVDRADCPDADGVQIHFGVVPNSYAWSFAKGEKVCLGLVKLNGTEMNVQQVFRQFLRDVGVRNIDKYPLQGAMIPFGNYMPHPVSTPCASGSVLFVGDAARLVEPLTGEGIFYALQSGVFAAQSGGDPYTYIYNVYRLHRLIDKGGRYQRWLMHQPLHSLMLRHAHRHPNFIEHFYSTQIEQSCLDSFARIVWKYKRGK